MTPIVNGLKSEFAHNAMVVELNANEPENARLQQQYGLRGHPTFAVLDRNNRSVDTFIGPQTEEILREALISVIDSSN